MRVEVGTCSYTVKLVQLVRGYQERDKNNGETVAYI